MGARKPDLGALRLVVSAADMGRCGYCGARKCRVRVHWEQTRRARQVLAEARARPGH